MGFDIKSILGLVGETALSFVPGASPILTGIAGIAKLIGGDTGEKIEQGLSIVTEGLGQAAKTPLSPEQQVLMDKNKSDTEIALGELAYKDKKLDYDDTAGGRDIVKTALMSDDVLVRQARPKMMILLGKVSMAYTIGTPLFVGLLAYLKVSNELLGLITNMILWQGATLWSAFMTSFTGYTVARSIDKNTTGKMANGMNQAALLSTISKIGKKIS